MAPRPVSLRPSLRSCGFAFALTSALMVSACGEGAAGDEDNTGGATGSGGQTPSGGQGNTGGETSSGGTSGQSGGASSGGSGPSSGGAESGGTSSGGGAGDSSGGSTGSGGDGVGAGGSGGEGSGGAGSAGECTRALLDGLLDDYFSALSAGDPSSLPLAADVKFTENAQIVEIGTTDFWMDAGDTKYSQRALDTTLCSAAAQAVIPEGGMDLPVAIRILVEDGELTEIETIVVRPGDYTASFAVDSNPAAIISIADSIGWHDEVPEGERASREDLIGWVENYFRGFPNGVCDTTSACKRLENGGGDFACSTGGGACDRNGSGAFDPRVVIADEERGIAAGFTIFDFMTTGHLDMHMIKMTGSSTHEVHAVQAILRNTDGVSGWE